MKRRILLINPWIYDFAAYDFCLKPVGLLYWAAILRKNGHEVDVLDCLNLFHPGLQQETGINIPHRHFVGRGKYPKERIGKPDSLQEFPRRFFRYGITPRLFKESLKKISKPDLIMVTSMMTYWYPGVHDAINFVREIYRNVRIVLGGNYVALCPEHAAGSGADVTIGIEPNENICEILGELLGETLRFQPDKVDLDSWPYPAYDLLPYFDQIPLLASRGCPFHCTYCASTILQPRFIQRDPLRVLEEIVFWRTRFGIRHFSFYDDALLVNPEGLIIPLLKNVIKSQLSCQFNCPNGLHVRHISEDLSRLMFQSGFKTIRLGFETSDPAHQARTGGKVTGQELHDAIMCLKKAGYHGRDIGVYLLCGLPGQKAAEVQDSIRFVQECGARAVIAEFSPIPRTLLWEDAVKISPYPIDKEPLFQNNTLLPCQSADLDYGMYQKLKRSAQENLPVD